MDKPGVCIFEDSAYTGLLPLVHSRAVFELRCGIVQLWEKIVREYGDSAQFHFLARPDLAEVLRERLPFPVNEVSSFQGESMLFLNGRIVAPQTLSQLIPLQGKTASFLSDGELVAFRAESKEMQAHYALPEVFLEATFKESVSERFPQTSIKATLVSFLWDVVANNPGQISADFDLSRQGGKIEGDVDERAAVYNARAIHVSPGARIDAGVVVDARGGPVAIGTDARISAFSRIEGPCSIGEKTHILGGRITGGSSFGPHCRIGGEVEQSVFQGHSNKYHEGFIGHSYIGEWVNLGALTTNSNLRNTYTNVSVSVAGRPTDTGMLKVGTFIGDCTRTGIGTLLDTGSVLGFSVNVFGGKKVLPKYLPSFVWGDGEHFEEYVPEKAAATARTAMERRSVVMRSAFERLMKRICELTEEERKTFLRPHQRNPKLS